jgi:hypothetical protein
MKHTWHKWLMTGLLISLTLTAAVVPALAQESPSSDANLARALSLGILLFGIVVILGVGFLFYINETSDSDT